MIAVGEFKPELMQRLGPTRGGSDATQRS